MKDTYGELLQACLITNEDGEKVFDMRLQEAEAENGHDVREGPCCCGAWHKRVSTHLEI